MITKPETLTRAEYEDKRGRGYAGTRAELEPRSLAWMGGAEHWHMYWGENGTTLAPVTVTA